MQLPTLWPLVAAALLSTSTAAQATIIYADTVLEYFHSGASGPASGSFASGSGYGGPPNASIVPLSNATDQDTSTYISLPTDSFISLGFSTGYVFDGSGDDLFVDEIGAGGEDATLFVSTDFGQSFVELTVVQGNQTNSLDLADFAFTGNINAVKLVGLDNGGGSPGFDVTGVWGLEDSTVQAPQGIPLPSALALLLGGLGLMALTRNGRGRR